MLTTVTLLLLTMMVTAFSYCWHAVCEIILYVSPHLSLTTTMKARLLVSKMNFSASNLWLCPQTVCVGGGTIHIVHARNYLLQHFCSR